MVVYHVNENVWFSCESRKTKEFFRKMKDCRFVWLLWSVCHGHVCWQLGTFYEPVERKEVKVSLEGFRFFSLFSSSLDLFYGILLYYKTDDEELLCCIKKKKKKFSKWERILTCIAWRRFIHKYIMFFSIWYHMFLARCLLDTFL